LGKINYYRCFVKNLAEIANPLYELLKKDCKLNWTDDCETAFQLLKDEVISAKKLSHFVPITQLILATHTSNKGIGTVLMREHDGIETDGLSRLSTQTDVEFDQFEMRENAELLCNIDETIDGLPITNEHVRNETLNDSTLKSVLFFVQNSNRPKPSRLSSDLKVQLVETLL